MRATEPQVERMALACSVGFEEKLNDLLKQGWVLGEQLNVSVHTKQASLGLSLSMAGPSVTNDASFNQTILMLSREKHAP